MKHFLSLAVILCTLSMAKAQNRIISNETELREFAADVNKGKSYEGCIVCLAADIILPTPNPGEGNWTPIGTATNPFNGTFDGLGHWISNLMVNIEGSTTGNVAGLFGCVGSSATVMRVGVASGDIYINSKEGNNDSSCFVGGIVGLNYGRIEQCANYAAVTGNRNMSHVGGIAGASGNVGGGTTTATIQNCYNRGNIFSTSEDGNTYYLGGIVGDTDGSVSCVYSSGAVSTSNPEKGSIKIGRIYGYISGTTTVSNAYSTETTLTGFALDGNLNTEGDYSIWTFADGVLPELTFFGSPITMIELSDNANNATTLSDKNGHTAYVALSGRTLWKDGAWNTLCLPFSLNEEQFASSPLAGATMMEFDVTGHYSKVENHWISTEDSSAPKSGIDAEANTIYLFFKNATSITAGKPYIIKWDSGSNIVNPVFFNVTISNTTNNVSSADGKITFTGTFSTENIPSEDRSRLFLGSANSLYHPDAAMTINACRAYFQLNGITVGEPDDPQSGIRAFVLNFGDDTTGIQTIDNGQRKKDSSSQTYDLQGRRVNVQTSKFNGRIPSGIYIHNGRKLMIK